jgi:N utilization substance protein A
MNSVELISSFAEFARDKNIDKPTMISVLEEVFRTMIRKKFGSDENFNVIVNPESGDLEMWRTREIVDDNSEDIWDFDNIPWAEAKLIEPDFEIGEEVAELIKLEDFGRRVVQTARQTLIQKIKDLEKESLYDKYKDLVGELVSAEVYQILGRELILIDNDDNELILPKTEMISKDRFKKGDTIKSIIHKVEMSNGTPRIIMSRISPVFLERLFEQEIPEIYDGTITIRKIVREPGERAKIAVESYDDRIDPVGACVGMKGSRIHGIVRELQNENIDVINYTENLELLVNRTLSPAKLNSMKIDKERKRISVYLNSDQVSMAIGRGGQNIKLAGKLVGYEIDVFRDVPKDEMDDEDVELVEFSDDIDAWILEELHKIGLDTAKQVLALSKEELERRTELEEGTIDELMAILRSEFE